MEILTNSNKKQHLLSDTEISRAALVILTISHELIRCIFNISTYACSFPLHPAKLQATSECDG